MTQIHRWAILAVILAIAVHSTYSKGKYKQREGSQENSDGTIVQPAKPRGSILTSSIVNNDGSFEFVISGEDAGFYMEVQGHVRNRNIQLVGNYEFDNITLQFSANEYEGFAVRPLTKPMELPKLNRGDADVPKIV